jgi:hypothetical protein
MGIPHLLRHARIREDPKEIVANAYFTTSAI